MRTCSKSNGSAWSARPLSTRSVEFCFLCDNLACTHLCMMACSCIVRAVSAECSLSLESQRVPRSQSRKPSGSIRSCRRPVAVQRKLSEAQPTDCQRTTAGRVGAGRWTVGSTDCTALRVQQAERWMSVLSLCVPRVDIPPAGLTDWTSHAAQVGHSLTAAHRLRPMTTV